MRNVFFLFLIAFSLGGCRSDEVKAISASPLDHERTLADLVIAMDPNYPGRGLADYPSDEIVDIPKGYAMILLGAQEEAKKKNRDYLNSLGVAAGTWLLANADANNDGVIGWGVPIAWDAYGDGSINPKDTEYSISTAIVIDALLGWLEFVDEDSRGEILDLIDRAFDPYLSEYMRTPIGLLPYSLLSHDRKYDTFNSAVYLAGQMQRYSKIVQNFEMQSALQLAADDTMEALIQHKKEAPKTGSWYWDYSVQETVPNDLPHASYIVDGILTYVENSGRLSSLLNKEKALKHLMDFIDGTGKIRGWPTFRPEISTPPRLYDLSIAAQLSCRFQQSAEGGLFLAGLKSYVSPDGGYLKYPHGTDSNRRVAEYEAFLYRALIACGVDSNEDEN